MAREDESIFSRREFVKGAVYASAGFALGGYALQNVVSMQKPTSSAVLQYTGALNVGGPAPRPLPLIPLEFQSNGDIAGVPEQLDWLWYCGLNTLPAIHEGAGADQLFRYIEAPEGTSAWYDEFHGDVMNRQDFLDASEDEGGAPVGAGGKWREEGGSSIPVIVIYLGDEAPEEHATDGFLATSGKCVHLCCVPGFDISPQRFSYDADGKIFCTCHKSVYDPRQVVERTYLADRPQTE